MKSKVCKIEECSKIPYAMGMCNRHYIAAKFAGVECVEQGCTSPAKRSGNRCIQHYSQWLYSAEGRQTKKSKAQSDSASYGAAHMRVISAKGQATEHTCVDCPNRAAEWSLKVSADMITEIRGNKMGGRFSLDVDDYEPRCVPCHRTYDAKYGNKKSGIPDDYTVTYGPETRAKAEEAVRLLKSGKTTLEVAEILGVNAGSVSKYFQALEGMYFRDWKRANKGGDAK